MKTALFTLILIIFPAPLFAQTGAQLNLNVDTDFVTDARILATGSTGHTGHNAAITGAPEGGLAHIGVLGIASVYAGSGVYGIGSVANSAGVEGMTAQASGVGVIANNISGGVALSIPNGAIIKPRTPRNILKVYNRTTGALVGEFEFEIVQE